MTPPDRERDLAIVRGGMFELRGGRVIRMRIVPDRDAAVAAALGAEPSE